VNKQSLRNRDVLEFHGGLVFKAGTKEKQHIVGIQANGQGSVFQLVYVEARGDDKEKKAD